MTTRIPASSGPSAEPATGPPALRMGGRACVDTSGHRRLPILMELVGALSRATDPQEVLRTFTTGMQALEGPRGFVSLSTRGLAPGQYKITRMVLDPDDPRGLAAANPWRDWKELSIHEGGFLGDLIRQAYPEIIHNLYLRDDPVIGDALADWGSLIAVPIFDDGEPRNWALSLHRDADGFTVPDLEETVMRANLVGTSVRHTLDAQQLRRANARIEREMEQIASIQRALLPKTMPDIAGLALSASYHTYDQAGGDYYDFFPFAGGSTGGTSADLRHGRWGILIADAAGHGPAAAVLMAMLHSILHCYPTVPDDPGVVLDHANEQLCGKQIESSFVTAIFGIYDPRTRDFTYARAGHPPALVKQAGSGGPTERLDAVGSVPLGILPGIHYESAQRRLGIGETLVLYTDGITEAMGPDRAMFDVAGIERSLHECSGEPDCVQKSIMTALREHEGAVRPSDDQTIVALKVMA